MLSLPGCLLIALAALGGRAFAGAPAAPDVPAPDCSGFVAGLALGYFHGSVTVPENWNEPGGRTISVFYYGHAAPGTRDAVPVIYFNGGPASDSHGSAQLLEKERVTTGLSVVFMDQRGTGCSSRYPAAASAGDAARLMNYGTRSIVKDAEAVRKALFGSAKWRVLGHSYGGMVAQRYAALFPESLAAVSASGYSVMSDPAQWMKLRILAQKRLGEEFFAQYPEDRAGLEKIRSAIPDSKCFTLGGLDVCGGAVMDSLVALMNSRDTWPAVDSYIQVFAGYAEKPGFADSAELRDFVNVWVLMMAGDEPAAMLAITRLEMAAGGSDAESCAEAQRELAAAGDDPAGWGFNECRLLAGLRNPELEGLIAGTAARDPLRLGDIKASLSAHPGLKLRIYIGADDLFDPPGSFVEERAALGSLADISVLPTGHEGLFDHPLIWNEFAR